MELTEPTIKRIFNPQFFRRGKKYFKDGHVRSLKYDTFDDEWNAEIIGSKIYHTNVAIHSDSISNYCDCPAFSAYGQCKHTCATMFAIMKESQGTLDLFPGKASEVKTNPYTEADDLIEIFDRIHDTSGTAGNEAVQYKKPVHVEFTLYTHQIKYYRSQEETFKLSMRIGTERLYIIKDLKEFLLNLERGIEVYFGKQFNFDPSVHYFRDNDQAIIDQLSEILNTEQFYNHSGYGWNDAQSKKTIDIPRFAVETLINKLQYADCVYFQEEDSYPQLTVSNALPFSFNLDKNEDDYRFKVAGLSGGVHYASYGYYGLDGILYPLTQQQSAVINTLMNSTDIYGGIDIPVSKTQVESFVTKSLPKMKTIGKTELAESIEDEITAPELKASAYIERNDDALLIDIKYQYDDIEINPLNETAPKEKENGRILIRNIDAEQMIMNILENSPLKIMNHQLFVSDFDKQFDFLYDTLPALEHLMEVYMTSNVRSMIMETPPEANVSVEAEHDGGYLEVGFKIDGIAPDDVSSILQSVKEKKRFYRLPNGMFVPLNSGDLNEVADLYSEFSSISNDDGDTLSMPMYRGMQVERQVAESKADKTQFNESFQSFYQSITSPETESVELPQGLNAELRDYQTTGFKWLKSLAQFNIGGILADDMGLGKTVQCIAYLLSEKENGTRQPSLIVSPASLTYNWKHEFEKFAPDLNAVVISGNIKERQKVLDGDTPDVYITSYHTLRQDLEWYEDKTFHTLILDEAQAVKNYATKISKAVRSIRAPKRFALSGTPIENSQSELWAIFQTIMPGFLYDQKTFKNLDPSEIARLVRPFILRRLKEDVLTELPEKIESVYYTELNKDQKKLYLAYLDRIQKETAVSLETEGIQKGRIKILAGLTRLRQLCCHPSLFVEDYQGGSGKLDTLFEVIENAEENNQRILLFSQFPSMLKIIREKLMDSGRSCYYLDGSTPSKERVELVDAYNNGDESIFLISLKAGGTGLNLTGADTVVLYDLWWNPAIEEQAIGRAHRIGQKNVVQVVRLISQGTIEEKINDLQQKKKEMIDQIIQPGDAAMSSMSEDDIREILSI